MSILNSLLRLSASYPSLKDGYLLDIATEQPEYKQSCSHLLFLIYTVADLYKYAYNEKQSLSILCDIYAISIDPTTCLVVPC
jgi:hypothetical protein